jgi:Leucine-rich repeat (LRR) protein
MQLPVSPASLLTWKKLDLSENMIVDIALGLCKLDKLKTLMLNKNPFVDFRGLPVTPSLTCLEFVNTGVPEGKDSASSRLA